MKLTETLCFRVHIEHGERWRLKQARFDARPIANHTFAMRRLGYSKTEIAKQVTPAANEFEVRLFHFGFGALLYNMWLLVDFLVQVSMDLPVRSKPRLVAGRFREFVRRWLARLLPD